jgi:hypothetical protein
MTAVRRRIRAIAIAWLLCQVASLSAFVPGECCASHAAQAAAKAKDAACHETADQPAAPKEGDACPMHHGSQPMSHSCCAISSMCDGPGQQLTTLFAYIGVVESPQASPAILDSIAAYVPPPPPLLHRLSIPDAPPPKS